MKNFLNNIKKALTLTPHTDESKPSGVMTALGDCNGLPEGSAIRTFLPVYLNKTLNLHDDLNITAKRKGETQHLLNPSVDLMGKLNAAGWNITLELNPRDTASALVFVMDWAAYEQIDLPVYPSMLIDLGNNEVTLVYRLDTVLDRASNPTEYRTRGILEEVMREKLHADIAAHTTLPVAGFFLHPSKDAVRIARYSRAYALDELISAFGAGKEIERVFKANPVANTQTGEVQSSDAEQVFNSAFDELMATGPLSMYKAQAAAAKVGQALMDAGVDEETRQQLAPEFHARIEVLEPLWTESEGITERDVQAIFTDPSSVTLTKVK